MNIWIGNHQSQGQANWFASDVTNRNKLPWNRYNSITSRLFFALKRKQLRISGHSFDAAVYPFHRIYSISNGTGPIRGQKNFMRLSAGSALYCELIADPYIHTNGKSLGWNPRHGGLILSMSFSHPTLSSKQEQPSLWGNIDADLVAALHAKPSLTKNRNVTR